MTSDWLGYEYAVVARLLPWLPARHCVNKLALVSQSALAAVREAFEVQAQAGEDLRALLENGRVPAFGTVRVPPAGVVLSSAIHRPLPCSVRIAPMPPLPGCRPQKQQMAAMPQVLRRVLVELPIRSICGIIEFQCAALCFDSLHIRPAAPAAEADTTQSSTKRGHPPLRIKVEEAIFTCRGCMFEAELAVMPPRMDQLCPGEPASLIERCTWLCSQRQGLLITGIKQSREHRGLIEENAMYDDFEQAGLRALRKFAGDLEVSRGSPVVVPNGARLCLVRDCVAEDVRHHVLFIRGDVFALVEGCALHGKVCIEESAAVELRRNPHLALCGGELLDPDFVGTLLHGRIEETPLPRAPRRGRRRRSGQRSSRAAGSGAAAVQAVRRASSLIDRGVAWRAAG